MNSIVDLDRDELLVAFDAASDAKAAKRLMTALAYSDGVPVETISDRYGIPRSTVYAWLNRFNQETISEAIEDDSRPGRPPALDEEDRIRLIEALSGSPNQHGFDGDRWTPALVRRFISESFDVEYSLGHARRLLREHSSDG